MITVTFKNGNGEYSVLMTEDMLLDMIKTTPRLSTLLLDAKTDESVILGANICEALKISFPPFLTRARFLVDYLGWDEEDVNSDWAKNIPVDVGKVIDSLIVKIQD